MGSIPINQPTLSKCGNYGGQLVPRPFYTCGYDDKKHPRANFVALQFAFSTYPGWLLDTSNSGAAAPPLKQVAAVFIDAVDCENDVTLLVADTGYRIRVTSGNSKMCSIISGVKNPKIYILSDDNGNTNADLVNVVLLDTFIPDFATSEFIRAFTYGYGSYYSEQPIFAQSGSFVSVANLFSSSPQVVINYQQWYITGLQLWALFTIATGFSGSIDLFINPVTPVYLRRVPFSENSAGVQTQIKLIEQGGLQIFSDQVNSGGGKLYAGYTINTGSLSALKVYSNIDGGILQN